MSVSPPAAQRITVPQLRGRKGQSPIVSLTAYTTQIAKLLDPHCDLLLVGDSLGMVLYGLPSTLAVTLDMMIAHGAAVVRGSSRASVTIDLPFGSYQESPVQAFRSAARVLAETGASSVKLEGGAEMAPTIRFLVERGIPVCAHIGVTPQSTNLLGGYPVAGRGEGDGQRLMNDARAVADAGAYAVVIEKTLEPLARAITAAIPIPTIGIGASAGCDGQVLVSDDMLGLFTDFTPRFVKRYAELGQAIGKAAAEYADDVRNRRFPGEKHIFPAN
jgi:3-methyl-2-oxobutanoate hydroxymethyltransferase